MFSQITRSGPRVNPVYICSSCLHNTIRYHDLPVGQSCIGEILFHHRRLHTNASGVKTRYGHKPATTPAWQTTPAIYRRSASSIARRRRKARSTESSISESQTNLQELREALAHSIDESNTTDATKSAENGLVEKKTKQKDGNEKQPKTRANSTEKQPAKKKKRKSSGGDDGNVVEASGSGKSKGTQMAAPPMNDYLIKLLSEGKLSKQQRSRVLRYLREHLTAKTDTTAGLSELVDGGEPLSERLKSFKSLKDAMKSKSLTRAKRTSGGGTGSGLQNRPGTTPLEIETIDAGELHLTPVEKAQPPVPRLSYGLERVLFNPGVYQLQDPRSRVYNFDPYLQTIMPVGEFDFNALKEYITSSKDTSLLEIALAETKKYTGSTSSMTSGLAHFHFLLSQWRPIHTGILSQDFPVQHKTFTALQRAPSAIFLRWRDGTYAIDADKQYDTANILSMLGKSMEKLLTLSTEEYEKYRKANSDQITEEERNEAEAFHYTTMGDFLMRSQLDAHDPRLPGTGMFDLKTRAVVSIRMDATEYEKGMGYEIRTRHGEWESYEREYYDMIRAAFLKYSLQVRMGRMDGIFVAYHNTERIFGFQYISLPEMDLALHGTEDTTIGDSEFKISLELLNRVLDRATARFPEKSLRIHFETRAAVETPFMYIFAKPIEEERIQEIQETNKDTVRAFEEQVLGLKKTDEEARAMEWERIRAKVEKSMENDETGIQDARAIVQSLIEQSDILKSEQLTEQTDRLLDEILSTTVVNDNPQEDEDEDREKEDAEEDEEEDTTEFVEETSDEIDEDDIEGSVSAEADDLIDIEGPKHENLIVTDPEAQRNGKEIKGDDEGNGQGVRVRDGETDYTSGIEEDAEEGGEFSSTMGTSERNTGVTEEAIHADPLTTSDGNTMQIDEGDLQSSSDEDILAMTLTIRNKVNGRYVLRPENLNPSDKWTVEYSLAEVPNQSRAKNLYEATKRRRRLALARTSEEAKSNPFNNAYMQKLSELAERGRDWRKRQNEVDREVPKKTLNSRYTGSVKSSAASGE